MTAKPRVRRKRMLITALVATIAAVVLGLLTSGSASANSTTVPGQSGSRVDADGNGYPDAGQVVSGNYTDTYSGADGVCEVRVNYRGTYENDPFLDTGWIQNHWRCVASDGSVTTYQYLLVHESDPRYTGNPDWSVWNTWEYKILTESGAGNYVRPASHVS